MIQHAREHLRPRDARRLTRSAPNNEWVRRVAIPIRSVINVLFSVAPHDVRRELTCVTFFIGRVIPIDPDANHRR